MIMVLIQCKGGRAADATTPADFAVAAVLPYLPVHHVLGFVLIANLFPAITWFTTTRHQQHSTITTNNINNNGYFNMNNNN